MPRLGRVHLHLLAQPRHVHRHRRRIAQIGVVPYPIEQLLAAEHLARMAGQEVEQLELVGTQLDHLLAPFSLLPLLPRLRLLLATATATATAGAAAATAAAAAAAAALDHPQARADHQLAKAQIALQRRVE